MQLVGITPVKTCATEASAIKAAEAKFGQTDLRYLVMKTDGGRFYPLFIGEPAIHAGVHFHFCVVG
jgi:hypothetical protein